jgi:hypothetical protein
MGDLNARGRIVVTAVIALLVSAAATLLQPPPGVTQSGRVAWLTPLSAPGPSSVDRTENTDYDLSWSTFDGGGGMFSTGGGYTLGGTIGQPDAGLATGGGYALGGAFWGGGALVGVVHSVDLPLVARSFALPFPDPPVLQGIENPDNAGSFTVGWTAVVGAATYVLQESTDIAFISPAEIYKGGHTDHDISGRGAARYFYRVKARNRYGDSDWSNVGLADVLWEVEPNEDALTQGNGPLASRLTYYGGFPVGEDRQDYFFFDLTTAHSVEVWLTNIGVGHDYDVYMRDESLAVVCQSAGRGNADEHTMRSVLPPGRYYVQVYNFGATGSGQPYHLRVAYE